MGVYKVVGGKERRAFDYLHVLSSHLPEQLERTRGGLCALRCEGMEAHPPHFRRYAWGDTQSNVTYNTGTP